MVPHRFASSVQADQLYRHTASVIDSSSVLKITLEINRFAAKAHRNPRKWRRSRAADFDLGLNEWDTETNRLWAFEGRSNNPFKTR
jgi:hypothetical protein